MSGDSPSERVLVWATRGRDAELAIRLLAAGEFQAEAVPTVEELSQGIRAGAGCAILTEEELTRRARGALSAALGDQPAWSDFPLIVFSAPLGMRSATKAENLNELGNVTILERPVHTRTLLIAVRQCLRSRRRQYEARRAIRQRDQFVAMLGHELRNPLGAILFALQLMNRGNGATPDPHLALAERQARNLSRLVDDLLDVTRLTSGKVVLQREPVSVPELVERTLRAVEAQAREAGVTVSAGDVAPIWLNADPLRVEQILNNLVTNAIKYNSRGGRVVLSAKADRGLGEIRVRDTGIGIPPNLLQSVFDLFSQVEQSLARSKGGLGIGLSLVKNLVELHGGTVQAKSEGLGKGSEFVVRLPTVGEPALAGDHEARMGRSGRRGLHVVLVEDNADVRQMSRDALEMLGCRVEVADDGPEGIDRIVSTLPDLALIDVGLPTLDGYAVAGRVRAALGARVHLVALTGYGQAEDRERARAAGFEQHLTKPVSLETLEALLEGVSRAGAEADAPA